MTSRARNRKKPGQKRSTFPERKAHMREMGIKAWRFVRIKSDDGKSARKADVRVDDGRELKIEPYVPLSEEYKDAQRIGTVRSNRPRWPWER